MNLPEPVPDQAALARIGAQVSARLKANPDVLSVSAPGLELFVIGAFLGDAECESLIAMIDAIAKPSALHELDYASGYRTSYSGDLDPSDPIVAKISRRIDALLGIDAANGEPLQGQRYLPGQEYKLHNDWFYTSESYWPQEDTRGGQRSWTAMAYCNDVTAGGATAFVAAGLQIEPRRSALLVWNNALSDGQPNERTLHAGLPVERGAKYIVTKWYRARQWG